LAELGGTGGGEAEAAWNYFVSYSPVTDWEGPGLPANFRPEELAQEPASAPYVIAGVAVDAVAVAAMPEDSPVLPALRAASEGLIAEGAEEAGARGGVGAPDADQLLSSAGQVAQSAVESPASESAASETIPQLAPRIAETFQNGEYAARQLQSDLTVYRAEGVQMGRWFGAVRPDSAAMAERMYNVATFGNDLTQVPTYVIPEGAVVYEGLVEGGTGWQTFVPNPAEAGVGLLGAEPLPQGGF
jgi:hypothetical protein